MALYQRYESQRIVGRQALWSPQQNEDHARALVNISKLDPYFLMGFTIANQEKKKNETTGTSITVQETMQQQEDILPPLPSVIKETSRDEDMQINIRLRESTVNRNLLSQRKSEDMSDDQDDLLPAKTFQTSKIEATQVNIQTSEFTLQQQTNKDHPSQSQSHEESHEQDALLAPDIIQTGLSTVTEEQSHYLEPVINTGNNASVEDRCFWPRIITPPSSPTADPHMRPRLSVNTLIRSATIPTIHTSHIALPIRKPRTKGLNEDEPLGIFTVFNAWSSYLIARILVIATFAHFYLWPSIVLILSHYAIVVAYLSFCNPCPNFWAPLLGLIFILCPVEVKVRYKYPKIFLISFFALVTLEDLSTVILWYYGADWESWWYQYAFFFIIGCHGMAALNAGLYLFMFKPKAKYIE